MMQQAQFRTMAVFVCTAALASLLTGCGTAISGTTGNTPTQPLVTYTGRVHGGQQPVSGATIQLYAVGNTGMASSATPLLTSTVITDANGNFRLTGLWNCANTAVYGSDPLLYLTAKGGNPGLASGTNNGALLMMIAIGRCSGLTPASYLYVDEVTTVAAAYALAPFMTDATHVGASTAYLGGLSNAFATVSSLVDPTTGLSPGPGALSGVIVPSSEINSLANSIATCINSDGTTGCAALFSAATPQNGTAPTDTLRAVLNIAASPSRNAASIYSMASAIAPFQPQLSAAPSDWTIALTFSGNGLKGPQGIAVDAAGNAWIANASGAGVTGLSSQGAALAGAAPYTASSSIYGAQAVAVDRTGSVWVADTLLSSVVKLAVTNNVVTSASSFSSGVSGPGSLAVDGGNNIWIANFGDGSVAKLSNAGALLNGSPISPGSLQAPAGVAVDASGNAWVTDNLSYSVFVFDKNGALGSQNGYSDGAMIAPVGVALDAAGRAWVADNGNAAVSLFAASGAVVPGTPIIGAGLRSPSVVAIDGAGAAWIVSNVSAGSVSRISASTTDVSGGLGALSLPAGEAIDASGNLWVTNSGNDTVSKFVGLASPVLTPLAANLPALP